MTELLIAILVGVVGVVVIAVIAIVKNVHFRAGVKVGPHEISIELNDSTRRAVRNSQPTSTTR